MNEIGGEKFRNALKYFLCLALVIFSSFIVYDARISRNISLRALEEATLRRCTYLEGGYYSFPMDHHMSDEKLFLKASLVHDCRRNDTSSNPKIAFMFLAHGSLPLSPLWERFFRGHEGRFSIYIHSKPSFRPEYSSSSVFYQRQVPSKETNWGEISLCDAERRLLANSLLDASNERFVLLSESCIPLYNFTVIYNYMINSQYSFMESTLNFTPETYRRYDSRMQPEVNITDFRKGSQWFEVDRILAVIIIRDEKYYRKFREFGSGPYSISDEHYLPTMLNLEAGRMLANRSLTWLVWGTHGELHPEAFGASDVTEGLMEEIKGGKTCAYNDVRTSVCFLFARKFSGDALESLLSVAPY